MLFGTIISVLSAFEWVRRRVFEFFSLQIYWQVYQWTARMSLCIQANAVLLFWEIKCSMISCPSLASASPVAALVAISCCTGWHTTGDGLFTSVVIATAIEGYDGTIVGIVIHIAWYHTYNSRQEYVLLWVWYHTYKAFYELWVDDKITILLICKLYLIYLDRYETPN